MQKLSHFFSKNISIYAIFNDQRFNEVLTNDMVSLNKQLGPGLYLEVNPFGPADQDVIVNP